MRHAQPNLRPPVASAVSFVHRHGGVAAVGALTSAGHTRAVIESGVRAGWLTRVRRGWYATVDAPADVVRAVRVGGALTAASVARLSSLWLLDDPMLHVRVPANAARLRAPDDGSMPLDPSAHGVCLHYRDGGGAPGDSPASDGLIRSLSEMFRCAGIVPAVVALESALNRGVLPMNAIDDVRALLPAWGRRPLALVSPDSDSGLETIARLLLHRVRAQVRTQVWIEGVRRVDLLVGDRLVLELDGRAFHSGRDFERDREQDLELHLRGYLVVRLSYRMVTEDWDRTHRAVLALVSRGLHRWGRVARACSPFDPRNSGDQAVQAP
jgi:very-short-patch-repair endonuclease